MIDGNILGDEIGTALGDTDEDKVGAYEGSSLGISLSI